jgi:CRISPR-associated protein Cas1
VDYGRPSLALDLLEEFRAPLVDRFAATVLALGRLTRPDFVDGPEGGVVLSREGLKTFFVAWEHGLAEPIALEEGAATFRDLFRRQAERLARALTQGETYRSFRLPC